MKKWSANLFEKSSWLLVSCVSPQETLSPLVTIKKSQRSVFCQLLCLSTGKPRIHMTNRREKEPAPPTRKRLVSSTVRHSYQLPACSRHTDTIHFKKETYSVPHPLLSLPFSLCSVLISFAVTTINMKAPPSGHSCPCFFHIENKERLCHHQSRIIWINMLSCDHRFCVFQESIITSCFIRQPRAGSFKKLS